MENLVSDILAGEGTIANLFLWCVPTRCYILPLMYNNNEWISLPKRG
jgi:hypothetical protein